MSDWQEAIHVACQPLIEQGFCNEEYIDAVFENTQQYGPYYVLCENLALIHASNKKGVFGTQMAVTVLKDPIKFQSDGYDVRSWLLWLPKTVIPTWRESRLYPLFFRIQSRYSQSWMQPVEKKYTVYFFLLRATACMRLYKKERKGYHARFYYQHIINTGYLGRNNVPSWIGSAR